MSQRGARLSRALVATAGLLAATALSAAPAVAAPGSSLAPLLPAERGEPNGGYLVVLKPGARSAADAAAAATRSGAREVRRYHKVMTGFSAKLNSAALRAVRANPAVAYVRADSMVKAIEDAPAASIKASATQTDLPSWGLDRIDQHTLPINGRYSYDTTGTGVTVYVVDSGIRATHADFGGRAAGAYNAVDDDNGTADCRGHGTHVAGTIGGTTYGVAKNVTIRAVRVINCAGRGTAADLIEGMDWIATNAPPRSIANFSLQNFGTEVNTAAERLIDAGVLPVFIGGNNRTDACGNNPRAPRGIQVGASSYTDSEAEFSNYGPCIDIWAPGHGITSAGHASDTEVAYNWSGTSMAAPHVSGWLARYLEAHPSATLAQAKAALLSSATTGAMNDLKPGSPDRLLYAEPPAGPDDTAPPTTPGVPVASNVTTSSATLSWSGSNDNVGVAKYEIWYGIGTRPFELAGTSTTASFTLNGLTAGAPYRVRVRAFDAAGNGSFYSPVGELTINSTTMGADCTVSYALSGGGGSAFTANLAITNTGTSAINGWTLAFALPAGQTLSQPGWSATFAQSGQNVTATPASWNSTIGANQSVQIGFNGAGTGTAKPTAFTLNGTSCSIA